MWPGMCWRNCWRSRNHATAIALRFLHIRRIPLANPASAYRLAIYFATCVCLSICMSYEPATAAEQPGSSPAANKAQADQEQAVALITQLGGKCVEDPQQPGKIVEVNLDKTK